MYLVRYIDRIQSDEVRYYRGEADKCTMRAEAAKRDKDALQGEKGNIQAQLSHQVKFPGQEKNAAEVVTFRGLKAFPPCWFSQGMGMVRTVGYLFPFFPEAVREGGRKRGCSVINSPNHFNESGIVPRTAQHGLEVDPAIAFRMCFYCFTFPKRGNCLLLWQVIGYPVSVKHDSFILNIIYFGLLSWPCRSGWWQSVMG